MDPRWHEAHWSQFRHGAAPLRVPTEVLSLSSLASRSAWSFLSSTTFDVGLNPSTFARDLQAMGLGRGYRLERLGLWDAFPQTHHFESLAVLECVS